MNSNMHPADIPPPPQTQERRAAGVIEWRRAFENSTPQRAVLDVN